MLLLVQERFDPPPLDTAVSSAILKEVAGGLTQDTMRLWVPERAVSFGRQDRVRPGYRNALAAVRQSGFAAVERLAGGRAAVFHEGTVAVAWASREERPRETTEDRFRRVAEITLSALRAIGIDAEIGETPGEYCPGRWSIKAKGKKVAGFGQRIVRGGAHVGGVIVVSNPQLVNLPLIPAYAELGYKWEPGATGSLSQSTPDLTTDQIITSLSAALADSINDVLPARPENRTISLARQLVHEHVPPE